MTEEAKRNTLEIRSVTISRGWQLNDPFTARIAVVGKDQQIEIAVDEQRTLAIIDVVADLIADSVTNGLEDLRSRALALTKRQQIEAAPVLGEDNNDDIPF